MNTQTNDFKIGVAVGSGFVATASERGGADFLLALNAGRLRNMGAPSVACVLPNADARAQTLAYAKEEILPLVNIPVLIGSNCWDDDFDAESHADELLSYGFSGCTNFPPSGLMPPSIQTALNRSSFGFNREIEMLKAVQEKNGFALIYCTTIEQARQAALAGLDHILFNYGWNAGGFLGHQTNMTLEHAALIANSVAKQVRRINPSVKILLEGGPIVSESDLAFILSSARIDGYIGGSTIERLPLERSISDRIASYRLASLHLDLPSDDHANLMRWASHYGFICNSPAMIKYVRELREAAKSKQKVIHAICAFGDSLKLTVDAIISNFPRATKPRVENLDCAVDSAATSLLQALNLNQNSANQKTDSGKQDIFILNKPGLLPERVQMQIANAIQDAITLNPKTMPQIVMTSEYSAADPEGLNRIINALRSFTLHKVLRLPALAERPEDVEELMLQKIQRATGIKNIEFEPSALLKLRGYLWPDNEREMLSLVPVLKKRCELSEPITIIDVDKWLDETRNQSVSVNVPHTDQKSEIVDALWRNGFRKGRAAQSLGISRKTLYNRMKRYGIG